MLRLHQSPLNLKEALPVEWELFHRFHPQSITFLDLVKSIVQCDLSSLEPFEITPEIKAKICLQILPFASNASVYTKLLFRAKTEFKSTVIVKEGNEIELLQRAGFTMNRILLLPDQTNLITWDDFENSVPLEYKSLFVDYLAIVFGVGSISFLEQSADLVQGFVVISRIYGPLGQQFWWLDLCLKSVKPEHRSLPVQNFRFFDLIRWHSAKILTLRWENPLNPPSNDLIRLFLEMIMKYFTLESLQVINIDLQPHLESLYLLLEKNIHLKHLELASTKLRALDFDFSKLPALEALIIRDNIKIQIPTTLPQSLKWLNLEYNNVEFTSTEFLAPLNKLEALNLNGNTFQSRFLEEIHTVFKSNPALKHLGLMHQNIPKRPMNPAQSKLFSHAIRTLRNLERLMLRTDTDLSDFIAEDNRSLELLAIQGLRTRFNSWNTLGTFTNLKKVFILCEFVADAEFWRYLQETKASVHLDFISEADLEKAQRINNCVFQMKHNKAINKKNKIY